MASRPHIALLIETSTTTGCDTIRGISEYARINGPWIFYLRSGGLIQKLPTLSEWQCDGVIARIETQSLADDLLKRKIPVVYIAGKEQPQWPFIGTCPESISQRIAEYFLDRGFRRFAYYGFKKEYWSLKRESSFVDIINSRRYPCEVFHDSLTLPMPRKEEKLGQWLESLVKPVAIMTCDDPHGREIIDVCRIRGIEVPEEVSVCGVDNDEMVCTMSTPPLSSLPINTHRIGYEAAAMLHTMLQGKPGHDIRDIAPLPVKTRQSTDLLAIEDPIVAEAVSIIRQEAQSGMSVKDILRRIPTSRRTLENHFLVALGRTPHEEIRRVQLARAIDLLLHTDLKTSEVARLSGFVNAQYLNNVFQQHFSQTPAAYRRNNRAE